MTSTTHFDIMIIGGGMVGAAMACALQTQSYQVALIDATPLAANDHRLIALNYSSLNLLKNLGIWSELEKHATPIKEVHVSHRGHFGATRLTAADLKLPLLGAVVPAQFITPALYSQLTTTTHIRPAKLKTLTPSSDQTLLCIETPQGMKNYSASLVIAADGTRSTVRDLLDIPTQLTDYQQSALVTTTQLNRSHHFIAYERFQKNGAIAMLPLPDNQAATIWTDDNVAINKLMQLSDTDFLACLQKCVGYRLGRLKNIGARYTYPLQSVTAAQKVKQRIILIGNAAHTLHPIAAQGLNLALYEIAELTDALSQQPLAEFKIMDFSQTQQQLSSHLSHQLSSLFSHDFFLLNFIRQLGLIGLDLCQPLKNRFIRHAIGQTGTLPALIRSTQPLVS